MSDQETCSRCGAVLTAEELADNMEHAEPWEDFICASCHDSTELHRAGNV